MLIANFREYTAVLRNICSRDVMGEIGTYYLSLLRSGEKLKQQKQELQQRIRDCKQKIERQAELIRRTENKKEAGLRLAEIKKQKQELVHNFKILQNGDHFNVLSTEAKIGVCCGFLLQKYLTRELLENNPLNFKKNAEGNLVVNPEVLENSEIFQEAVPLSPFTDTEKLVMSMRPGITPASMVNAPSPSPVTETVHSPFSAVAKKNINSPSPASASGLFSRVYVFPLGEVITTSGFFSVFSHWMENT